jgi:hypothetical protein
MALLKASEIFKARQHNTKNKNNTARMKVRRCVLKSNKAVKTATFDGGRR